MDERNLSPEEERQKILNAKTPYETLFLPTTATPEEAKYQYFKLVKRYSPEKEEEAFRHIRRAYEELRDPARKASVDVMLFTGPAGRVRFAGISTAAVSQLKLNREIEALEQKGEGINGDKTELLEALKQRSVLLAKNRNWNETIKDLDRVEELEGLTEDIKENKIFLLSRLAIELADRGQYADAAHRWRRALRLDPNRSYILHNLAVCSTLLLNKEDETRYWVDTLRAWHRDLAEKGDDTYLKHLIIETHKRFGGRYLNLTGDESLRKQMASSGPPVITPRAIGPSGEQSQERSPSAPSKEPLLPGSPATIGMEAFAQQNWRGAIASFEMHLKQNPQDGEIMNKLGWGFLHGNQANRAFATWQKMILEGPGQQLAKESYVQAKLETARNLRNRRMINPALVQLKDALKVVSDSPAVYQELGDIYYERQEWLNAAFYYEKALELNPNDKGLRQLARSVRNRSRSTRAIM
jgi:tetratricopeptide (TPR) repeat protein